MRNHVDWQDGGRRWEGPEILPADEPDVAPSQESEPSPLLPVLWAPFPALPAAPAVTDWPQGKTPAPGNRESAGELVTSGVV